MLIHENIAKKEQLENNLRSVTDVLLNEPHYYELSEGKKIYRLRKKGSDLDVHHQVIIQKEYQPIIDYFLINNKNPALIIDCGANIGLSSMRFAQSFPEAQIIAVEPDENNYKQLVFNTQSFANISPRQNAIWTSNEVLKLDRNFRDGEDWSIRTVRTSENDYQNVQAITVLGVFDELKQKKIDLLKIDIEGAESELFKDEESYSFLEKTDCIAIEIHDECVDRRYIYDVLKNKGFKLFNSGELTIGIR